MNGFREELLSRILGINGHIGIVSSIGMPFNNYQQAAKEIAEFDNVKTVIPMIENQLLVSAGKAAEGAMIRGISKDDLLKKDILRDSIKNINPEDFGGNNVIVGVRLANKMGIVPGDEITLISPNGKVTAFGTVPRMKSYKVLGTFEVGMFEYDSNFIFMPLEAAQVYFGLPGAVMRERAGEYLMLRLRTSQGISAAEYEKLFLLPFAPLEEVLEKRRRYYQATQNDSGRWVLTPQGYLVSNDIITDLLIAQDSSHPLKRI